MNRTTKRQSAAPASAVPRIPSGLLTCLILIAGLATPAVAGMYRPPTARPGGIDPHPWITSIVKTGATARVNWYGLEGAYHLQMTPALRPTSWTNAGDLLAIDWANSLTVTNLTGPMEFFRLGTDNGYVGQSGCSSCHSDVYEQWQGTHHATALDSLNQIGMGTNSSCLVCHTVGFGEPTGYTDAAHTPRLANVGCENCHGPGGAHKYGDHSLVRPAVTYDSKMCGGCHNVTQFPIYTEWLTSPHTQVTPDVASGFTDTPSGQSRMLQCGPCHSGAVRIALLKNATAGYPLILPSAADASSIAETCVVCHDPHVTNTVPAQLRNPLHSTNFYSFATGTSATNFSAQYNPDIQVCAQCHNMRGAVWTTTSRPPHHSPQYNMLLGTAGVLASGLPPYQPAAHALWITNQCVGCHMQTQEPVGHTDPGVTGHTFQVQTYNVCLQCHPLPEFLVDFTTGSVSNQIQQVKAGLDLWALTKAPAALRIKYGTRAWEYTTPGELSPGGPGPTSSEQALIPVNIQKARFNMYIVLNDGSYGVHNGPYSVTLLNTALNWVQQELQ